MMGRWTAMLLLSVSLIPLAGCRICADCEDLAYPAYGGAWQRTRRDAGRVGSVFDPAGAQAPTLVERDDPPTPDALERERQQSREGGFQAPDRGEDPEAVESNSDVPGELRPSDSLLELELDDIQDKKEEEMRQKSLDDINIHVVPRVSIPPNLQ